MLAQPLHDYPFDPALTDCAQIPGGGVQVSGQAHWRDLNGNADMTHVPMLMSDALGHSHFEPFGCWGSEVSQDVTIAFQMRAFQGEGKVFLPALSRNPFIKAVSWDDSTGPDDNFVEADGTVGAVVVRHGHMTFDINGRVPGAGPDAIMPYVVPAHGWFVFTVEYFFYAANGSILKPIMWLPFYSVKDPMAPEALGSFDLEIRVDGNSLNTPGGDTVGQDNWGTSISTYKSWVPLYTTITPSTPNLDTVKAELYQYGGQRQGLAEVRCGMDLHHGIPGTVLFSAIGTGGNGIDPPSPFAFNTIRQCGTGTFNLGIMWTEDSGAGMATLAPEEQIVSFLVFPVTVSDDGAAPSPPPPPPPPPPTQTWTVIGSVNALTVQQLIDSVTGPLQQFRLCDGSACSSQIQ